MGRRWRGEAGSLARQTDICKQPCWPGQERGDPVPGTPVLVLPGPPAAPGPMQGACPHPSSVLLMFHFFCLSI